MKKKKKQIAKCQVLTNWTTRSELGRIKQIEFCGWRKLAQKQSHLFWRCHSFQRVNPNSILINLLLPAITPLRIQKKNEHKLSMGFSFFFIKTHKFCYGSVKIMWAVGVTSLGVDFFFFFCIRISSLQSVGWQIHLARCGIWIDLQYFFFFNATIQSDWMRLYSLIFIL